MAGGKLSVEIGADITDFEKKIKEVEFDIKELSKIKLDRLKVGLDTTEINNQIKDAKASLNSLKTAVKDTGQTFASASPKVANAGNTLTQFSRIAQDAPFGIIGIGNNITATAEAFSSLKAQTGSTGGALKALASSIAGPGGILLGVSLLTTGLTYMAQSGLSVGDVIDKLRGNFDEFGRGMQKVNEEAAKNSGSEIANMKALVSVAQDDTLSRQQRLLAVKQLQDTFPAYFGNLKQEQILNGNVTGTIKDLSKALIARATATALAGKLGELAAKRLELEQQREQNILDIQKQQLYIQNQIAKRGKNGMIEGISFAEFSKINLQSLTDQYKETQKSIRDLDKESEKYSTRENKATKDAILLLTDKAKAVKQTFNTPQVTGVTNAITPAPLFDVKGIAVFNGQVDEFGNKIKELPGVIKSSLVQIPGLINENAILMAEALLKFNDSATEIINTSIADTFAGLGNAIGSALATADNVLSAVGKTLLSSLGGILIEIGKMAISVGVGLLGIKAALKTLNPYAAIGAGVALIALGSFFASKSSSIGNSMGGAGRASNSSGSGANNQSFSSSGFSGGGGGGTVVFEISGQKLIGVLSNTINANRRLGGTLGLG